VSIAASETIIKLSLIGLKAFGIECELRRKLGRGIEQCWIANYNDNYN